MAALAPYDSAEGLYAALARVHLLNSAGGDCRFVPKAILESGGHQYALYLHEGETTPSFEALDGLTVVSSPSDSLIQKMKMLYEVKGASDDKETDLIEAAARLLGIELPVSWKKERAYALLRPRPGAKEAGPKKKRRRAAPGASASNSASGPEWLGDFETYLFATGISDQNHRSVMRSVRKLAAGLGIQHPNADTTFKAGTEIDMETDFKELKAQAKVWVNEFGDKSNGWLVGHPVSKLLDFKAANEL